MGYYRVDCSMALPSNCLTSLLPYSDVTRMFMCLGAASIPLGDCEHFGSSSRPVGIRQCLEPHADLEHIIESARSCSPASGAAGTKEVYARLERISGSSYDVAGRKRRIQSCGIDINDAAMQKLEMDQPVMNTTQQTDIFDIHSDIQDHYDSGISIFSSDNTIGAASLSKHLAQIVCQFVWFFVRRKVSSAVMLKFSYDPIAPPNPTARKIRRYIDQAPDWITEAKELTPLARRKRLWERAKHPSGFSDKFGMVSEKSIDH
jgi:hypothetical protein